MPKKYPVVIGYDIVNNNTRAKILYELKKWRLDGQKSLHECLLSKSQAQQLFNKLKQISDPETDRIMLAWITKDRPMHSRGSGHSLSFFQNIFHIS